MSEFAKVGGVPKDQLIVLEQTFCEIVDFRLSVDSETYNHYITAIRTYGFHF